MEPGCPIDENLWFMMHTATLMLPYSQPKKLFFMLNPNLSLSLSLSHTHMHTLTHVMHSHLQIIHAKCKHTFVV